MPDPTVSPDPPAPSGLMLFPACHSGAPVRVTLDAGKMFLACGQCWHRIAEIAFVDRYQTEIIRGEG